MAHKCQVNETTVQKNPEQDLEKPLKKELNATIDNRTMTSTRVRLTYLFIF